MLTRMGLQIAWCIFALYWAPSRATDTVPATYVTTSVTDQDLSNWNVAHALKGHHNVTALHYMGFYSHYPRDDMLIIEDFTAGLELHYHMDVRSAPGNSNKKELHVYKIFAKKVGEPYSTKGRTVYMQPYGGRQGIQVLNQGFPDTIKEKGSGKHFAQMKGKEMIVGSILVKALKQQARLVALERGLTIQGTVDDWITLVVPELRQNPTMKRVSGQTADGSTFTALVTKYAPRASDAEPDTDESMPSEQLDMPWKTGTVEAQAQDQVTETPPVPATHSVVREDLVDGMASMRVDTPSPRSWAALFQPNPDGTSPFSSSSGASPRALDETTGEGAS